MTVKVKVLKDSLNCFNLTNPMSRIITLELYYPRFIHSEVMTHRALSKNFSSSRAIPFTKMLAKIKEDPAIPVRFGANQKGMGMRAEDCQDPEQAQVIWLTAMKEALGRASQLNHLDTHKTLCNRIIEPYQHMNGVVTGELSAWLNFLKLRLSKDADENIQLLAREIQRVIKNSSPTVRDWHLPYIDNEEYERMPLEALKKASVARCARVSYITHGKSERSMDDDIALFERLSLSGHFSPFEHVASVYKQKKVNNFKYWSQFRDEVDVITKDEDYLMGLIEKFL